jgi:hypothetical protein
LQQVLPSSPKQNCRNLAATELLYYRLRISLRADARCFPQLYLFPDHR